MAKKTKPMPDLKRLEEDILEMSDQELVEALKEIKRKQKENSK